MNVFAYGFRTFFLLAGLASPLALACWLAFLFQGHRLPGHLDPLLWHAHEMLFGFVGAMVAGFLLTAVPNWTGQNAASGRPLMLLGALWIAGRLLALGPSPELSALVDLAFLPALFTILFPPLLRSAAPPQKLFLPVLSALWVANLLFHLQALGYAATARWGLSLAVTVILLLITMIGGRVIPFFTRAALGNEPTRNSAGEVVCLALVAALPVMNHLSVPPAVIAAWGFSTALAHGLRCWGWSDRRLWKVPLLWVLYLGYGWMVLGFFLRGGAALGWWPESAALHAFTAGAMGSLGLGIMARASLGHTGRPLLPARTTVLSFALLQVAALLRVTGPLLGLHRVWAFALPGTLWCLSFLLFLWVYGPILTQPRADGRPG
jgi:uncharacterized protein involved in response to NO